MKLSRRNMMVVSFMLFSLFFGAGNLIFPPFLGQNAGNHTLPAMLGFLMTAVLLPVLGVIVVAHFDGLDRLGRQVGKRFSLCFTVLIYLSIGPGLGMVGPAGGFAAFSPLAKVVMTLDMLFGRLELYPMLILLLPTTWAKK